MFGYVTVLRNEMSKKDYELFTAYYCGLCRATGKCVSQFARLGLSYDITFLAIVLSAVSEGESEFREFRCAAHINEKRKCIVNDKAVEYAARAGTILSYLKLRDDVRDEKSIKSLLKSLLFLPGVNRSEKHLKKLYREITARLDELGKLERENCADIDRCADCFAKILECIFTPDFVEDKNTRRILTWFGYNTGRWIYILDAFSDMEKDKKEKAYNPFLAVEYSDFEEYRDRLRKQLDVTSTFALENISSSFNLLETNKNKALIEHIIYTGLKAKQASILEINTMNGEKDESI